MRILNPNSKVYNSKMAVDRVVRLLLFSVAAIIFHALAATSVSAQASNIYITPDGSTAGPRSASSRIARALSMWTGRAQIMNLAASCSLRVLGLAVALLAAVAGAHAQGTNRFVTETGASSGNCTTGVISRATFNNTTLNPDDVVLICGTLLGEVDPRSAGTAGHPVIIRFDTGAKALPANQSGMSQLIYLAGQAFITIDGGVACGTAATTCNGQVGFSSIGSNYGGGNSPIVFMLSGAHDIEIKNLNIGPGYQKTATGTSDGCCSNYDSSGLLYMPSTGVNIHIHDNKIHDTPWCINGNTNAANANLEIDHNYIYDCSHGIAWGANGGITAGGMKWHHNTMEGPVNWDTGTSNDFHHDGMHLYCIPPSGTTCNTTNIQIYDSVFEGDWGRNVTSPLFVEVHEPNWQVTNITVFNNTFTNTDTGWAWTNGINILGHSGIAAYNNTIVCGQDTNNITSNIGLQIGGAGADARNNIVSNCQTLNNTGNETTSFAALDYNLYANLISSGNSAFSYNGTSTSGGTLAAQFSNWKTLIGRGVEAHSITASSAILNSSAVPQTGSPAINAGQNLTSLCTGNLVPLCSDINGNARPSSGAWTIGAHETQSTASAPPPAPSGLKATVN